MQEVDKPERDVVEGDNPANYGGQAAQHWNLPALELGRMMRLLFQLFHGSTGVERAGCRGAACSSPAPTR